MKQLEFIFWFLGCEFFQNRRLRCTFLRERANVQKTSGVTASVIKNLGLPAGVKCESATFKGEKELGGRNETNVAWEPREPEIFLRRLLASFCFQEPHHKLLNHG